MTHKDFISQSLREAAKISTASFGMVAAEIKGTDHNQVLTQTDIKIGNLLVSRIKDAFPNHTIIDEESGVIDKKSSYTWVVDPIDGTSNFASGLPMYGIMLGLLENDTPIIGGVILPAFNEFYYAEKGNGAYCNDKKIEVTQETNLLKCLAVYAIDAHQESPDLTNKECLLLRDIVLHIRNYRVSNCCFDQMMVAKGRYAAWLNRTSMIWDNVAPQIIIEEAGGMYTDFIGRKIDYSHPITKADKNFTVCAAPHALHKTLQKIIQKHGFVS